MSSDSGEEPGAVTYRQLLVEPPEGLLLLADQLPTLLVVTDAAGEGTFFNTPLLDYLGRDVDALRGRGWLDCLHPDDRESTERVWRSAVEGGHAYQHSLRLHRAADGSYRWHRARAVPLRDQDGRMLRWLCVLDDIDDQVRATRRQEALAELGLFTLEGPDLPTLMDRAARIVAELLEVEFCKVLRRLPEGNALLLEAGVGWRKGLVGTATVPAGQGSQAGFALEAEGPVRERDLRRETRFSGSPLLTEHGAVSGMSVVIQTPGGPYGVLGAHTTVPRTFSETEATFLQAVANILGEAVERQGREAALRASEVRFRGVFENAAVGIALIGADQNFLDVNQHLCDMLGYAREELLSRPARSFGHPDDEAQTVAAVRELLEGVAAVRIEKRYLRKDGSVLWADVMGSQVRSASGELAYFVIALQDITARKQAEEAREAALLQEEGARREAEAANARLSFLAEASRLLGGSLDYQETLARLARLAVPDLADWCAVDLLDDRGVLERLAIAHQDPEKVRWVRELRRRYPPDPQAPTGSYQVARTGEPGFYPEIPEALLEKVARDEAHLELLRQVGFSSAVIVPLASRGRTLGVLSLVHAESGRRFGERDLELAVQLGERAGVAVDNARLYGDARALNEELEARVKVRTEELETANRELEAFTYSTSHDLRAPLRGIDGFSQALLEDYGATLDDSAKAYLARIRGGAQRMGELIDDLLGLSRISRSALTPGEVDLGSLAASAVAALREREPGRAATVEIEDGLVARGDARLLRIALENLLGNAWKFTAGREPACIEVGVSRAGEEPTFFVRDNGVGFDMAYADKLFSPFQRLHSPAQFEGTGIGLATVQRIIHRHGGRIWAESEEGKGATFYFTLPTAPPSDGRA